MSWLTSLFSALLGWLSDMLGQALSHLTASLKAHREATDASTAKTEKLSELEGKPTTESATDEAIDEASRSL